MVIVDLFCGGGGASTGIRDATGHEVTVALNHSAAAIEMHAANHPKTIHRQGDVWKIPSWDIFPGKRRPKLDLLWLSPDCTHHSRARGGKPRQKGIRDLPWIGVQWARDLRPRVIGLENVEEIQSWGPLDEHGKPIPERAGEDWQKFIASLELLGYAVEWRTLTACDYGAPTSRRRLFLVARCDGEPIVWPEPTHGPGRTHPYRTAAECIDWSDLGHSIFLTPEEVKEQGARSAGGGLVRRPLAAATQRRIAEGLRRFVLEAPEPYIVRIGHQSSDSGKVHPVSQPLRTITTKAEHLLCSPSMVQIGYGERKGQSPRVLNIHAPLTTIVASGQKHGLVSAFLSKHYGGVVGHEVTRPLGTVTTTDHHSLGACFLSKYYGTGIGQDIGEPCHTIPTVDRFALVTAFLRRHGIDREPIVTVDGEAYAIVDVSMRMLKSDELARCQGFPADYILTGSEKDRVARIGNSVPPQVVEAVIAANFNTEPADLAAK